jgi:hypothetical protein
MEQVPTILQGLAAMLNTHLASMEDGHALDTTVQALDQQVTEGFERSEHLRFGPAGWP